MEFSTWPIHLSSVGSNETLFMDAGYELLCLECSNISKGTEEKVVKFYVFEMGMIELQPQMRFACRDNYIIESFENFVRQLTQHFGNLPQSWSKMAKYIGEDPFRQGFDRISSAPRLSFSSEDVFNVRNHHLSQLSRSSPGIYKNETFQHQVISNSTSSVPKSILVKPKETEMFPEEEKEDQKSYYSLRFELQFSAFVLFFFILVVVIPISMIVMGSLHLSSCPAQVMIPIFLIVGGASFLFSIVLLRKLNKLAQKNDEDRICYRKSFTVALIFQLGWFIAGCYWIYGSYEPDYSNEESTQYCHKTLYMYSFWFLNAIFLSLSLFAAAFTIYVFFGKVNTQPQAV